MLLFFVTVALTDGDVLYMRFPNVTEYYGYNNLQSVLQMHAATNQNLVLKVRGLILADNTTRFESLAEFNAAPRTSVTSTYDYYRMSDMSYSVDWSTGNVPADIEFTNAVDGAILISGDFNAGDEIIVTLDELIRHMRGGWEEGWYRQTGDPYAFEITVVSASAGAEIYGPGSRELSPAFTSFHAYDS